MRARNNPAGASSTRFPQRRLLIKMQKRRKRKHLEVHLLPQSELTTTNPRTKLTSAGIGFNDSPAGPYPAHPWPTPEECRAVRDDLLALHGFPREFLVYRNARLKAIGEANDDLKSTLSDVGDGKLDEKESVLDGLVKTVLSQNTTEANSERAFASLKSSFPTWEESTVEDEMNLFFMKVLEAEPKCIQDAIRCGGLATTKASCINNILKCLLEKRGKLCLEYLRGLSVDEIKAELSNFKGIGPKTVSCVLMFHLQRDDFPVDTHVFEIGKAIGWVPTTADRNKAYYHLNQRIPNPLKFDLNCLLYTHGKLCRKCIARSGTNNLSKKSDDNSCPLLNYFKIS